MRLGNSNGNNRGKKYFIRGRDDVNPDKLYEEEARDFSLWFEKNYRILRRDVRGRMPINGDAFSETYLKIYELILYTGQKIRNYKAFFHRAYYTNYVQLAVRENRYCNFHDHVEVEDTTNDLSCNANAKKVLVEENNELLQEEEYKQKCLQDDIMNYVYQNYQLHDFEIFKMYMDLKPAVNYHAMARMTGQKYHRIQRAVSGIMMDVRQHNEFHRRRKECRKNCSIYFFISHR